MPDGEISIMEALNQVQSWLNSKEYDRVIQGCQEILSIEPGNQRALSLMKQAEEARHEEEQKAQEASQDPLENLAVAAETPQAPPSSPQAAPDPEPTPEAKAEPASKAEPEKDYDFYQPPRPSKQKMFLAMVIPAVLVVVVGGFIVNMLNNSNRDQILGNDDDKFIEENDHKNDEAPDTSYLAQNEQRVTDLTMMADAIEEYYADFGSYPNLEDVKNLIKTELGTIPVDPRQGDEDASGDPYGYMYALYDFEGIENGAYILSAIFQDSKGEAHAWAQGASTKNYDDFREIDSPHVIFIGD